MIASISHGSVTRKTYHEEPPFGTYLELPQTPILGEGGIGIHGIIICAKTLISRSFRGSKEMVIIILTSSTVDPISRQGFTWF